jgi:hypothetical protein
MLCRVIEPISPELVLVSPPDVAARARERLSEPSSCAPAPRPMLHSTPTKRSPARPGSSRRRLLVLAVLLLAALTAGALVPRRVVLRRGGAPTSLQGFALTNARPSTSPQPRTVPSPSQQRGEARSGTSASTPETRSAATAPSGSSPGAGATKRVVRTRGRSHRSTAPHLTRPARTFAWAPADNAAAYSVTFYRNGRAVLERRVGADILLLPRTFRFRAGEYRWTVVPIYRNERSNHPAPIVDSTFVVEAAPAR